MAVKNMKCNEMAKNALKQIRYAVFYIEKAIRFVYNIFIRNLIVKAGK